MDGWVDMHLRMRTRRSGPITSGGKLVGQIMHTIRDFTVQGMEEDISSIVVRLK